MRSQTPSIDYNFHLLATLADSDAYPFPGPLCFERKISNIFSSSVISVMSRVIRVIYICLLTCCTNDRNGSGGSKYFALLYNRITYIVTLFPWTPKLPDPMILLRNTSCSSSIFISKGPLKTLKIYPIYFMYFRPYRITPFKTFHYF